MPIVKDKLQGDKDNFIEFFLCPRGQQLEKGDGHVAEDEAVVRNNPSHGTKSLSLKTSCKATKTTLLNFFFALAGSSMTKMTVVWKKTKNDEEFSAMHHKPIAEDKF
jgi:hypothetical protein